MLTNLVTKVASLHVSKQSACPNVLRTDRTMATLWCYSCPNWLSLHGTQCRLIAVFWQLLSRLFHVPIMPLLHVVRNDVGVCLGHARESLVTDRALGVLEDDSRYKINRCSIITMILIVHTISDKCQSFRWSLSWV